MTQKKQRTPTLAAAIIVAVLLTVAVFSPAWRSLRMEEAGLKISARYSLSALKICATSESKQECKSKTYGELRKHFEAVIKSRRASWAAHRGESKEAYRQVAADKQGYANVVSNYNKLRWSGLGLRWSTLGAVLFLLALAILGARHDGLSPGLQTGYRLWILGGICLLCVVSMVFAVIFVGATGYENLRDFSMHGEKGYGYSLYLYAVGIVAAASAVILRYRWPQWTDENKAPVDADE